MKPTVFRLRLAVLPFFGTMLQASVILVFGATGKQPSFATN